MGLSEDAAIGEYGEDGIEASGTLCSVTSRVCQQARGRPSPLVSRPRSCLQVFHAAYDTVEMAAVHRMDKDGNFLNASCYAKVVTKREAPHEVLGIHLLGPHAGEVLQGFSVAYSMGLTWQQLRESVGIHPTHAEEIVDLHRTKRSGISVSTIVAFPRCLHFPA